LRFAEPGWLWLLAFVPLPWLWERARPRIAWPTLEGFRKAPWSWAVLARHLPPLARALAIATLALAAARPQTVGGRTRIAGKGVAIVVALDRSSSMNAPDFVRPEGGTITRLEAARSTFARFVQGRSDDLIGLVAFANYPDLTCPPTLDHRFLLDSVAALRPARREEDGTNLGHAIAKGLEALRAAPPRMKVLVLLTDGQDAPAVPNPLDPEAMAQLARDLGITLHTIAVGHAGRLARPRESVTGLPLPAEDAGPNLDLLARLANVGGGQVFLADDARGLDQVFHRIDALEKSPVTGMILTRYREEYGTFVVAGLVLLAIERLLVSGRLSRLP
jgi:Ca-activated chloride channel family protein